MTDGDLAGWRGTTHPGRLSRLHGAAAQHALTPGVAPNRPLVQGRLLPERTRTTRLPSPAAVLGSMRRQVSSFLRDEPLRRPERTGTRMLVLVPAHDAEATIGRTLDALLGQTRAPDRVVVLAEDCTDRTEEIARRRGVTVMRTVDDADRRLGALNLGWRRWQAGYDVVAVIDADTAPAPDCLDQLADELRRTAHPGAVTARVDQGTGATATARWWIRLHRQEPGSRATDAQRENGTADVAGRASLYSGEALRAVAASNRVHGPWDPGARIADAQLAADLRGLGHRTVVSTRARARVGPTPTVRSLRARPTSSDHARS